MAAREKKNTPAAGQELMALGKRVAFALPNNENIVLTIASRPEPVKK
ncbi:MAG: hypothetical protein KatS3mg082_0745 [Nitrospiraceae bacterium]|nr:MAG: hypothetical protein KatS3mg082_0745 [Nitrospiraceae bacterium]